MQVLQEKAPGVGFGLIRGRKHSINVMDQENTPKTTNELLAAMADGELDLRDNPDALTQIAQDPQAAQRIAYQQQLKQACGKAMDGPEMKCPGDLSAKLKAMASPQAPSMSQGDVAGSPAEQAAAYDGPPVIGRIARWVPSAVAAVLLITAGILYTQANPGGSGGLEAQAAAFLSVDQIDRFNGRHGDCAMNTKLLKQTETFGSATEFDQLPGKLGNYFQTSTDGMRLSLDGIGYDYELTGACALPGRGAVHIVYRNQDDPNRSISVWVMPAGKQHETLEEGRVYVEAGSDLTHPVIFWRQGGLLYYLLGDSLEDANRAVQELRQAA